MNLKKKTSSGLNISRTIPNRTSVRSSSSTNTQASTKIKAKANPEKKIVAKPARKITPEASPRPVQSKSEAFMSDSEMRAGTEKNKRLSVSDTSKVRNSFMAPESTKEISFTDNGKMELGA